MNHAVRSWLLLLPVGLASCQRAERTEAKHEAARAPASAEPHRDEQKHASLPTRVRLDPAVLKEANIRTARVVREVLAPTLDLPGEVTSDPDKTAQVSALVAGRIDAVRFKEGQTVRRGDVLALIRVPDLSKARAAFAATSARAASARANADRLQSLAEKRLAANQEVSTATAEARALEAEASAAEAQLRALGLGTAGAGGSDLTLRAPVSGVVVSRNAVVGQPVTADDTLATIADLAEVWFMGRVFEKNLEQVRIGAAVEVELNAYPKERFNGSVEYLGKQIDPTARTVVARIRLSNRAELLRLGLFGVAHVRTADPATSKPVLVVERSAVTEVAEKQVVFVRQPDGDFDLHEVVIGQSALGKVEIVNGLREGEEAVVEGVFTLKSAVLKSTFGEEGE